MSCEGGGSQPSQTTTQNNDPWSGQQPYLKDLFAKAGWLSNNAGLTPYQGQRAADWLPAQQRALTGATNLMDPTRNNPLQASKGYLNDALSGKYLNMDTNPFLQSSLKTAMGASDSQASQYGAYGSSDWQNQRDNMATKLVADTYNNERNLMNQAVSGANAWNEAKRGNIGLLGMLGGQQQQTQQNQLNANKALWDETIQEPWQRMAKYADLIRGNYGGSSTSTQTQKPPGTDWGSVAGGVGSILGGLAMGGSL